MSEFKKGTKAVTNQNIENVFGVLPAGTVGVVTDKAGDDLLFFEVEGREWAVLAEELDKQED